MAVMMKGGKATPKKAKLDCGSVKEILDQSVVEILRSNGYVKEFCSDISKLLEGVFFIAQALFAHIYFERFKFFMKLNRFAFVFGFSFLGIPRLVGYFMRRKNVFLFTEPLTGSRNTTGLAISSKLARSSDLYTLTIASADPKSPWARPPVKLTKSFTEWFASDGVLMEDIFSKDVVGLVKDYAKESNKSKWGWLWRISISFLLELFLFFALFGLGLMIY